jgi:hypothetical protein
MNSLCQIKNIFHFLGIKASMSDSTKTNSTSMHLLGIRRPLQADENNKAGSKLALFFFMRLDSV